MPRQVPVEHVAHAELRVVDVAVVVVEDVLPPVRRPADAVVLVGDVDQVPVVPVDVAVPSVRIRGRNQRHDEVLADAVVERPLLDREPVSQLHQHLGRARLAAVQAGHQHVDRPGPGQDRLRLALGQPTWIRQPGEVAAVGLEVGDRRLVGNRHHHHLAALVGAADGRDRDPRRGVGEGPVVVEHLRVVGQLARRSDVVAEDVLRRRDGAAGRQVVDEGAEELGARRPLAHPLGEVGVQRLPGPGLGGRPRDEQERVRRRRPRCRRRATGGACGDWASWSSWRDESSVSRVRREFAHASSEASR